VSQVFQGKRKRFLNISRKRQVNGSGGRLRARDRYEPDRGHEEKPSQGAGMALRSVEGDAHF
jgi:hypothetical protein